MKKALSVFIIFFFFYKGESQTKTFRNSDIKLEYPKTWKTSKFNGYVLLISKELKDDDFVGPNPVYVYPNRLNVFGKFSSEMDLLKAHASKTGHHIISSEFIIHKLPEDSKFLYRIDYIVNMNYSDIPFKKVEYIYKHKNFLRYCYYTMRQDLFDKYYDEAMQIINSITPR